MLTCPCGAPEEALDLGAVTRLAEVARRRTRLVGGVRGQGGPGWQGQLAPDHLARRGAASSPSLSDLTDNQQAAPALVIIGRMPQPWQGGGVVKHLDEQPAFKDQPQADLALRIPHGIGEELRAR